MMGQQPPQGPPMFDCPQFAPPQPQFEQRQVLQQDPQQFDANLESPNFLAAQQHSMQHPFDMMSPLEHLPTNPMEANHHLNLDEHVRHNMFGIEDVGAQNIFGHGHHHHHHHFLEPSLGIEIEQQEDQNHAMDPQLEEGARTWGKGYGKGYSKGKGYNKGYDNKGYDNKGYDDKGYGYDDKGYGYDDKGYGGYEDKGYSKGYNSYNSKGYDKGYPQKGYSKG